MKEYIVTCSCGNIISFARESYSIYKCGGDHPEEVVGRSKIRKLADGYTGTNFGRYLQGLASGNSRFAYYFRVDENGNIEKCVDLRTGQTVA